MNRQDAAQLIRQLRFDISSAQVGNDSHFVVVNRSSLEELLKWAETVNEKGLRRGKDSESTVAV